MIDDAVNKSAVLTTTSHLLEQTPRRRKITDPLVGLGSLLLRRAVRIEQKTMAAEPSQSDRKSYIPRDMVLFRPSTKSTWTVTAPSRSRRRRSVSRWRRGRSNRSARGTGSTRVS